MSRFPSISLVLLLALACSCSKPEAEPAAKTSGEKPAEKAPSTPVDDAGAKPATGEIATSSEPPVEESESEEEETGERAPLPDHFDEIGVAVCDQYVADLQRCIDEKVPEAEREGHRRTLADNHASWTQTKKGGESAAQGLQIGCRGAREQAKAATSEFGCAW